MVNVIVTGNAVCLKSHLSFTLEPSLLELLSLFARHKSARLTNAAQPYRENKHNTSRDIRDAVPSLINRPGRHSDIVVLKYHRDSLDTYEDVLHMVGEIWNARRSSFLPKVDPDNEDEEVDIDFAVHLGMTTAVPEFRAEKIAYRDGYERPGEDGVYVGEDYFKKLGLPESLKPAFDIDSAVEKVKTQFAVCSHFLFLLMKKRPPS